MTLRSILIIVTILFATTAAAQSNGEDTSYFNNNGNSCEKNEAAYYKMYFQASDAGIILEKTYHLNNNIRSKTYYESSKLLKKIDSSQYYYLNGKINWTMHFDNYGNPRSLIQLHPNGKIKRIEHYENGSFVNGKKYNDKGARVRFSKFQRNPTYKGGYERMIAYLNRSIRYPPQAKELNIHGTVIVSFVVSSKGKVLNPIVEKSVQPILDNEALRVVRIMKQWVAGSLNDKKVNTRISIPITFGNPDHQ